MTCVVVVVVVFALFVREVRSFSVFVSGVRSISLSVRGVRSVGFDQYTDWGSDSYSFDPIYTTHHTHHRSCTTSHPSVSSFVRRLLSTVLTAAEHCALIPATSFCRACSVYLEHYLHLLSLFSTLSFRWFVPGVVRPLHASMLRLLELDHLLTVTIPASNAMATAKTLLDQVFRLVGNISVTGARGSS
jgi:hypothetical protein